MLIRNNLFKCSRTILIGLLITSLLGCGAKTNGAPKTRGIQAIPVQTTMVETGDLSSVNSLTGTVISNLQTNVGSKLAGRVISVNVDMGQEVHQGQVLAQLDPVDLQRQLDQTGSQVQVDQSQLPSDQASYEQAKADFERYEALYNSGAASKADYEQYRLKMNTAEAKMHVTESTLRKDQAATSTIEQQLSELTITSPVDGIVATKNIEIGEQISTQTNLFTIVQGGTLQVAVNVPEQMITSITPGTETTITFQGLAAQTVKGKVSKISPAIDTVSHAYPVKIDLDDQNSTLKPGMTVSVQFSGLKSQPGILIPVESVVETPQGSEVFVVENNVAHMHLIQLGAVSSDKAVVTSGLKAGEQLVINGQDLLSDGAKVNVVKNSDEAGVQGMIKETKQGGKK